jgi:hypothetical protein
MAANIRPSWRLDIQFACPRCYFSATADKIDEVRTAQTRLNAQFPIEDLSRHRRIILSFLTVMVFGPCLALPANAAQIDAASINSAEFDTSKPPSEGKVKAVVVKAQVLLDRARFSPGEIDGKRGENTQKALKAFAESKGLSGINAITPEVWKALGRSYCRVQDFL